MPSRQRSELVCIKKTHDVGMKVIKITAVSDGLLQRGSEFYLQQGNEHCEGLNYNEISIACVIIRLFITIKLIFMHQW